MCGIVGVVAERSALPILMEGLRRLEYRGYDSAGIATITADGKRVYICIRQESWVDIVDTTATRTPFR